MSINSQKIENNNIYTFPNGDDLSRDESWLYSLLLDHPFFIKEVKRIRANLNIPKEGFNNNQLSFDWEHANSKNHGILFLNSKKLISKFKIPNNLISNCVFFTADYIINKNLITYLLPEFSKEGIKLKSGRARKKIPGTRIIIANENLEINKYTFTPGKIYLEIFPHTTSRDIAMACKKITEIIKDRKNNKVQKPQTVAKDTWDLTKIKKGDKKISKELNDKYGKSRVTLGYSEVAIYRKRYKDALNNLKKL